MSEVCYYYMESLAVRMSCSCALKHPLVWRYLPKHFGSSPCNCYIERHLRSTQYRWPSDIQFPIVFCDCWQVWNRMQVYKTTSMKCERRTRETVAMSTNSSWDSMKALRCEHIQKSCCANSNNSNLRFEFDPLFSFTITSDLLNFRRRRYWHRAPQRQENRSREFPLRMPNCWGRREASE